MKASSVVVVILLLAVVIAVWPIATIIMPKITNARMEANGNATTENLRLIHDAETALWAANQQYATLSQLTTETCPPLLSGEWICPRNGYIFTLVITSNDTFTVLADPVRIGGTGIKHYFVDQTGIIRVSAVGPANSTSPPLTR